MTPAVVSDDTADRYGFTRATWRAFVREHALPHTVWRRRLFVDASLVIAALGMPTTSAQAGPSRADVISKIRGSAR